MNICRPWIFASERGDGAASIALCFALDRFAAGHGPKLFPLLA